MADTAPVASKTRPTGPLRAMRVIAWVMAVVAVIPLFGLADLMTLPGWVDPQYEWKVPLEASWGSLFTFVTAGSCLAIALKPDHPWPAIVLLAIAASTLALGALLGLNPRPLTLAAIVAAPVAVFIWLARKGAEPFPNSWKLSLRYLLLAVAGVPIWLFYALHALEISKRGNLIEDSITLGIEHWPVQASTGLTLGLSVALMAVWVPSQGLLRVTTSLSSTYIGAAMLAYPDRAGAMDGPMWGVAMVLWGTVLALPLPNSGHPASILTIRRARRTQ
jgi:hypothetical protein